VFPRTLAVSDLYFGREHPLGMIQLGGPTTTDALRGETQVEARLAGTRTPHDVAQHAITFQLSTEDLPRSDNRGMLDGEGRGRLHPTPPPPPRAGARRPGSLGIPPPPARPPHPPPPPPPPGRAAPADVSYQAGTCRFGKDPSSSVLDTDCRAHELDNL